MPLEICYILTTQHQVQNQSLAILIWVGPYWACGYCITTVPHLGLGSLVFKLGLRGSHLYTRRGGVSLEGKQEE
jgi:hypothetical protein